MPETTRTYVCRDCAAEWTVGRKPCPSCRSWNVSERKSESSTFTGYIMLRHKPCNFAQRIHVGPNWRYIDHIRQHGLYRCGTCSAKLYTDDQVIRVRGTLTDGPCDDRCMEAVGDICLCSCGGQNHGKKWELENATRI